MTTLETWLKARPRNAHTARAYRLEAMRLLTYLVDRDWLLGHLTRPQLRAFWRALGSGRLHHKVEVPSPGSIQQTRRIVAAFLRWCVAHRHAPARILLELDGPAAPASTPESKLLPIDPPALLTLRELTHVKDLDAAAAALCFWVGASPAELAALTPLDIDSAARTIRLRRAGHDCAVSLPSGLARALTRLPGIHHKYYFGTSKAPSPEALAKRVAGWLQRNENAATSARSLRSQFLVLARAAGWSLDEIRTHLRRPKLEATSEDATPSVARLSELETVAA